MTVRGCLKSKPLGAQEPVRDRQRFKGPTWCAINRKQVLRVYACAAHLYNYLSVVGCHTGGDEYY